MFTTVDLFEGTGLNYVLVNIISVARFIKEKYPSFPGPHLMIGGGSIQISSGGAASTIPAPEEKRERPRSMRAEALKSNNKKFCDSCGRKNLADSKFCIG